MNVLEQIKGGLVVPCQALPGGPLYSSFIMGRMALTIKQGGAVRIYAQSRKDIIRIEEVVGLSVVGIAKRSYPDSDIYITAAKEELDGPFETGREMIAMDTTLRDRPDGKRLEDPVSYMHERGVLAMMDCPTYGECANMKNIGFDCISTTLYGYIPYSKNVDGPNPELFKKLAETIKAPILMEGKINIPEDLAAIYGAGVYNAVVGGTIIYPEQIIEHSVKILREQDKRHSFDKIPGRMCNYMHMMTFGYLFLLPAGTDPRFLKVL